MLDHLGLSVPQDKYEAVVDFYIIALAPLGYEKLVSMFDGKLVALGDKSSPMANNADFWLSSTSDCVLGRKYAHWAFVAEDRGAVDAFHLKALEVGGTDNGAPGLRPHFGDNYYATFITDPMGNNVEVVCRKNQEG